MKIASIRTEAKENWCFGAKAGADIAIWLSQSRRFQRWACIVGLASQPFWFWAVWDSGQWGVAVVAVVCALAWVKGLWVHWLAPRTPSRVGTVTLPPARRDDTVR